MSKKKKVAKTAARTSQARKRLTSRPKAPARIAPSNRTSAATIFVYDVGGECRVRTSPQLLSASDGFVEWTVVNLTPRPMPDVDITWISGSPWGGKQIPIRNGNARIHLAGGKPGKFKYNVTCHGYTEDPELEYPEN